MAGRPTACADAWPPVDCVSHNAVAVVKRVDMYGWGHNEEVLGRAIRGRRDRVVLVTKFGQTRREGQGNGVDGSPRYVQQACEASLKRLGVDVIDVYYQHRVDPSVPIEDTVGAMAALVRQGKVRFLGLSEARPETISAGSQSSPDFCRANRVLSALQDRSGGNGSQWL